MPVRTARLAHGSTGSPNTISTVYTAPAGHTAIVKDIRVYAAGGAVSRAIVDVSPDPNVSLIDKALTADEAAHLECWIVLEPGQHLRVYAAENRFHFWVSGTELEGVAPNLGAVTQPA